MLDENKKYDKFLKLLDIFRGLIDRKTALNDFIIYLAFFLRKSCSHVQESSCGEEYLKIIDKYSNDNFKNLAYELAKLMDKSEKYVDILGEIYMILEKNINMPRFYTPVELNDMMVRVSMNTETINNETKAYVKDTFCGSGRVFFSMANYLQEIENINVREKIKFVGEEENFCRACMCFIQMELYDLASKIVYQNKEKKISFITPRYFFDILD